MGQVAIFYSIFFGIYLPPIGYAISGMAP
jgi:hypothetical protein